MAADTHILSFFDDELDSLSGDLDRMGVSAQSQLARALRAVSEGDAALARSVIADDAALDALKVKVETDAVRILTLRNPLAQDLRRTLSALKLAGVLERVGDFAKNISRRSLLIDRADIHAIAAPSMTELGDRVSRRLDEALAAHRSGDAERLVAVWRDDAEVEDIYGRVVSERIACMKDDPRLIDACTHTLFIARNLSRVGDHAALIAETAYYEATGETPSDDDPDQPAT